MAATNIELAYDQAMRSVDMQARALDEIRSRTGVLLAGASLVTSFLGAHVLKQDGVGGFGVLALVAFVFVALLTLRILSVRRRSWKFTLGARVLLEDWVDEPERADDSPKMMRFIAETLDDNYRGNQDQIESMFDLFNLAVVMLACEVVFWALELA